MGIVDVARWAASGAGAAPGDDDVHLGPHQLGRERRESVGLLPVPATLDEDVLALDVPQFPQPLEESLPEAPRGAGRRGAPEKAYPIDFRGRLCPGGERRGEEAARDHRHERSAP